MYIITKKMEIYVVFCLFVFCNPWNPWSDGYEHVFRMDDDRLAHRIFQVMLANWNKIPQDQVRQFSQFKKGHAWYRKRQSRLAKAEQGLLEDEESIKEEEENIIWNFLELLKEILIIAIISTL